jgi:hypothetical protein
MGEKRQIRLSYSKQEISLLRSGTAMDLTDYGPTGKFPDGGD